MSTDTTVPAPPPGTPPPSDPGGRLLRNPGRLSWRLAGGVLSVGLIATGAASAAGWLAYRTETQDVAYHRTVSRVVVDARSGDVALEPGTDGEIRVQRRLRWSWDRPQIEETWSGDTLRIRYTCRRPKVAGLCDVDYRLRVPAGVPVEAATGSGDMSARGLAGALTLHTGSGNVSVSHTSGALTLVTGSGDVSAVEVTSPRVTVVTSSGDVAIDLTARPQTVKADTGSGDVSILVPPDGRYRVSTGANGDVAVGVAKDPAADASVEVSTGGGDVSIGYR